MLGLRNLFRNLNVRAPTVAKVTHGNTILGTVSRSLSTTSSLDRGCMTKVWTERRERHHRITRKRMRNAITIKQSKHDRYVANIKKKRAYVNS